MSILTYETTNLTAALKRHRPLNRLHIRTLKPISENDNLQNVQMGKVSNGSKTRKLFKQLETYVFQAESGKIGNHKTKQKVRILKYIYKYHKIFSMNASCQISLGCITFKYEKHKVGLLNQSVTWEIIGLFSNF